jgi:hypothetical protein
MYYDNACTMRKYVTKRYPNSHVLQKVTPVDVFHHTAKHKGTDLMCQTHCNPARFRDLWFINDKNEVAWRWNSSAAEQTNAWFGRFLPIVREMKKLRYNFFLDEMLRLRNEGTILALRKAGKAPHEVGIKEFMYF